MGRLYGLDALRGIAALAVALHHVGRLYGLPDFPWHPGLAVDLFFMLSGFVMARTYEARLNGDLTPVGFIRLRYRRLFLPMAIGTTIGLVWALSVFGAKPDMLPAYLLMLAFLPAWWLPNAFLFNGPVWSLFAEIVCNALHAVLFAPLSKLVLLAAAVSAIILFLAIYSAGLAHWDGGITSILWLIPRELACYLVGILVFRHYGDKPLGNVPLAAVAGFPACLSIGWFGPVGELVMIALLPFVLRASLGFPKLQWAMWAGALSYPLYATHFPILKLLSATPVAAVITALLLAFMLAARDMGISLRPLRRDTSRVAP